MALNSSKMNLNIFIKLLTICLGVECLNTNEPTTIVSNTTESTEKKVEGTTVQTVSPSHEISTTTCNINSSCFANSTIQNLKTTPFPTTVAQTTMNSSNETEISTFVSKRLSSRSERDICICDLKVNYCDVNCCCDSDCSFEDKMVFSHCEDDFHHYDTRFCHYTKHIYINNTAHKFQVNENGLFCVMAHNAPPSYLIQRKERLTSFHEIELEKVNKYSWPHHLPEHVENLNYIYSYGKTLIILKNNHLHTFQFLRSFVVTNCVLKEEVKYLTDIKSSCTHTDISEDNLHLKIDTYFVNMSIIANPILLNASYMENDILQKCPKGVCLTILPKLCDKYFENCSQVEKNTTKFRPSCHLSLAENRLICSNLVKHVKYDLYHNGTDGIVKADLSIHLVNVTYTLNKNIDFPQTFEVNFLWWNHTLNYSSYLSGSPGYLVGKPILTADIISVNISANHTTNSTTNGTLNHLELKLFRNPFDFTKNFMVLPYVNTEGICVLNKHEHTPIEFGYNLYLKCKISETLQTQNNSAKTICAKIQQTIFKYWSLNLANNTLNNRLVGQFGNASVHNPEDWMKLMFKDDLNDIVNRTWGEFVPKQKQIICRNITTLLVTEFYYSRIDFEDVVNQNKILATTLQFDGFKNVSFPLTAKDSSFNFSVKVGTQVAFFDVTTKKIRKFVDPPSLQISLPHDFFYPFVKVDNLASRKTLSLDLFFLYCIFITVCI